VQTLVIGCGNPLRSDDAAGWVVAEQLSRTVDPELATVLAVHQLTPELAAAVSRARRVIFIDAAANLSPGALRVTAVEPAESLRSSMMHALDAPRLLALAGRLFGRCPPACLLAIGGSDFGLGQCLSAEVEQACRAAAARVRELVRGDSAVTICPKVTTNA
jgi:hydrogenase maturation protease